MSHSFFRKFGKNPTLFFATHSETPPPISPEEQMKRDAIKAFPDLAKLADKVSPTELYNRAKVMSKLKDMADNPEKTFGTVKSYTNGAREATKNLKAVLTILESNPKIQEIANTTITAWFKGWDGPGDTNVAVVSGTNMSIRRFIGNVINDSQLIAQLFSAPEKAPESKESEEVRQRTRFGTFLLALETRYPSSDYKAIFRQAHEAL